MRRFTDWDKITRCALKLTVALSVLVITAVLMIMGYEERGEFCIGGECLIPPIAILYWFIWREVDK